MFPAVANTYCTLNVRDFPFDEQRCDLILSGDVIVSRQTFSSLCRSWSHGRLQCFDTVGWAAGRASSL